MKTLSKVLSMLLVIVMCVSLFGTSAYASGLAPLNGGSQPSGLAPLAPIDENNNDDYDDNNDDDFGSGLAPIGADNGSTTQSIDGNLLQPIETDPGIRPFAEVDDIEVLTNGKMPYVFAEAVKVSGANVQLQKDVADVNVEKILAGTIDLNGYNLTFTGALTISNNLTVTDTKGGGKVTFADITIDGTLNINAAADFGAATTVDGRLNIQKAAKITNSTNIKLGKGNVSLALGGLVDSADFLKASYDSAKYDLVEDPNNSGMYVLKSKTQATYPIKLSTGSKREFTKDEIDDALTSITSTGGTITFDANSIDTYTSANDITVTKSTTINLNNNVLEGNIIVDKGATVTINGNQITGDITITNGTVVLNGVEVSGSGNVTLTSGTLKVNNAKVGGKVTAAVRGNVTISGSEAKVAEIESNSATITMDNGTVGTLTSNGASKLKISGGYIGQTGGVTLNDDTGNNLITGGRFFTINDLALLEKSLNTKYMLNGDASVADVVLKNSTITPTPTPGPGQTSGKFTVYNGRYVKGSNTRVYITESTGNQLGGLWIGTKYNNVDNVTDITAYTDSYYSPITIDNSYLDSLSNGTYYLYTYYTDNPSVTKYVGQLTILSSGGGTNIPDYDGTLQVGTRYENDWYQGDDPLQFYVSPNPGSTSKVSNMRVYIDGRELGNLDYYDYLNGYFYVGTAKLSSLGSGTHWLTVENIKTGETGSCTFYVGPTLRARDSSKHVTGSSKDLKFVCSEPITRVWVGDKELDNYDSYDYYTLSRDRKTLTLTARFLNNRTAGNTYNLTVETETGERVSTTFQILTKAQASSSPKTGDNSNLALWISALVMSGAAAAVIIPQMKKKEIEG